MASEYSVNIKLNTAQVKKDLKTIGDGINNLGKKQAKGSKAALSDAEKQLKLENESLRLQNQGLGLSLKALPLQLKGVKLDEAALKIQQAATDAEKFEFDLAKNSLLLADKEIKKAQMLLKVNKDTTKNKVAQVKLQKQMASPIGGSKFMMGSPAQMAFSGGPSSPIGGSRFIMGSPAQLANSARVGGPRSPIGGLPSIPGSPAALQGRRGFDFQSALISGGFPLLFGQGPVTAAAGALGGGIGGMFGQMGGFAGGIAATTAVQSLSNFTRQIGELGNALSRPTENIGSLVEKLGLANDPAGRLALRLEKLGLTSSASALLMEEFTKQTGKSPDALRNAAEEINEMNKSLATFSLKLQLLGAEAITPIVDALNKVPFGAIGNKIKPITNLLMFGQFEDPSETVNKMKGISNIPASEGNAIIGGVPLNPDFGKTPGEITTTSSLENLAKDMEFNKEIRPLQQALEIESKRLTVSGDKLNLMKEQFELDNLNSDLDILRLQNQVKSTDQLGSQITKLENQIALQEKVVENAEALIDPTRQVAQIFAQDMGNAIKGLIQGTQTLNQSLSNVLKKLADAFLNRALFGNVGGKFEKGGGLIGKVFGGLFANGGRPPVGKFSVVGEKGPELFVPDKPGTVIPNSQLGGMGGSTNIVVNVDASGTSVSGDQGRGQEFGQIIAAVVKSTIVEESRQGGLLNR